MVLAVLKYVGSILSTCRSVTLLVQAVLPCALFADSPSCYILRGGTNADFAPQADYTIQVMNRYILLLVLPYYIQMNNLLDIKIL